MRHLGKAMILFSFYAGAVYAESCDAILDEKLMTASSIVDQSEAESAARYAFCNKSYSEMKQSTSGSIGGSYKFFSVDASKDESSFAKWKQSNCASASSSSAEAKYRFSAQKALGEGVVEAWRDCMLEKTGLSCLVAPGSDNETVKFIYSWRPQGSKQNVMTDSVIYNGSRVGGADVADKVAANGSIVYPGRRNVMVSRKDVNRKTIIAINTLYNEDAVNECSVEIPGNTPISVPAEQPRSIAGRWCYSSASGPGGVGISPSPSVEYVHVDGTWKVYLSPDIGSRIPFEGVATVAVEEQGDEFIVTETSRDMRLPPPMPPSLYFRGPLPAPGAVVATPGVPGVIPAPGGTGTANSAASLVVTTSVRYAMPNERTLQARSVSVRTNSSGDRDAGPGYPLIRYSRCD